MEKKMRLLGGRGPEITVPEWFENPEGPTPEEWVDWFLVQSRDAQLIIAAFHIDNERAAADFDALIHGQVRLDIGDFPPTEWGEQN